MIGFATIVFDYHNEVPFVNVFHGQHVLSDVNFFAKFRDPFVLYPSCLNPCMLQFVHDMS